VSVSPAASFGGAAVDGVACDAGVASCVLLMSCVRSALFSPPSLLRGIFGRRRKTGSRNPANVGLRRASEIVAFRRLLRRQFLRCSAMLVAPGWLSPVIFPYVFVGLLPVRLRVPFERSRSRSCAAESSRAPFSLICSPSAVNSAWAWARVALSSAVSQPGSASGAGISAASASVRPTPRAATGAGGARARSSY
jgi:hypothetical protein